MYHWELNFITFFPIVGALIILLPFIAKEHAKWIALFTTIPPFFVAIMMYLNYDIALAGINDANSMQYVINFPWIEKFNIHYSMGIDGLSYPLIFLTTLLCPICVLAAWKIDKMPKGFFSLFLLLDTGMAGTFAATDFFLFFVFWEVMLLPMYFLIGIWGGPRKEYAAIKFFLYTLFGSVFMLLVMAAFYIKTGTFDFFELMAKSKEGVFGTFEVGGFQFWAYLGLFIGFAIKVPMFPFHTWLPDAHVEAPTSISVILAGVLLKMGTYGILRIIYPILPEATQYFATTVAVFGAINILYGACCAMAQKDLKKMVAYSSVSHMGYVLLGMSVLSVNNPAGMTGAVMQMFNHGTITAMLFLLVGVIYDRAHHREIEGFGGLASHVPVYAGFTTFAFFAALGLPGLSGFISEALIFVGSWSTYPTITLWSVFGILLGAAYLLWTMQRVFMGKLNTEMKHFKDIVEISGREKLTLIPIGIIVLALGIYPKPMLDLINASVGRLLEVVNPAVAEQVSQVIK
ncbi:NADH-quinone oxidoreductase subunit M [bacterium]|nr:NADH-quinone oxidoreductase subunit M [bacterium]